MRRQGPSVLRSALFSVGMLTSLALWGTTSLILFPLPYRARFAAITSWADFVVWWLKVICKVDFHVTGLENVPTEPAIVFAKHQSTWETMFLIRLFRPQTWVLKRELLWLPVFGWAIAQLRPIAINRASGRVALKQILRKGRDRLGEGIHIVVYPEGTRVAPGHRGRYGVGGALLAHHTGAPLVPVAHNAGRLWPRQGFLKIPGTIEVIVGPPMHPGTLSAEQLRAQAEAWIEGEVDKLDAAWISTASPESSEKVI